jgi:hypothetical protein
LVNADVLTPPPADPPLPPVLMPPAAAIDPNPPEICDLVLFGFVDFVLALPPHMFDDPDDGGLEAIQEDPMRLELAAAALVVCTPCYAWSEAPDCNIATHVADIIRDCAELKSQGRTYPDCDVVSADLPGIIEQRLFEACNSPAPVIDYSIADGMLYAVIRTAPDGTKQFGVPVTRQPAPTLPPQTIPAADVPGIVLDPVH